MSRREKERPGDEGQAGRRRRRWSEFREAYPRIVAGMVVFIGFLLAADAVFAWRWMRYRRETREMRASPCAITAHGETSHERLSGLLFSRPKESGSHVAGWNPLFDWWKHPDDPGQG